ncbi:MAG: TlpA family protein disulfide reductase [Chloroflexi bacterium]|nr:TlpA family protein disulfide reductase [Chloroflexota bacterium]
MTASPLPDATPPGTPFDVTPPNAVSQQDAASLAAAAAMVDVTDAAAPSSLADEDVVIRRLRRTRALLWAAVGVMVVGWLFLAGGLDSIRSLVAPAPSAPVSADIGQPAPPLTLPLAGGGDVDLASYRGQVVLVNFWATWCPPCKAEMPDLERVYQRHRDRGFAVLAVDLQEKDEDVLAFLREMQVSYPSAIDRTGEAARAWRATGLPTSFLIDRDGIIRDVRLGAYTESTIEERLAPLLGP